MISRSVARRSFPEVCHWLMMRAREGDKGMHGGDESCTVYDCLGVHHLRKDGIR